MHLNLQFKHSFAIVCMLLASLVTHANSQERGVKLMGLKSKARPFGLSVSVNHRSRCYRPDDRLRFEVRIARGEAWIYAIYEMANGETLILFPNNWNHENRMIGGETKHVPPKDDPEFEIVITGEPLGLERLKIIALDRPLPAKLAFELSTGKKHEAMQPLKDHQKGALLRKIVEFDRKDIDFEVYDVELTVISTATGNDEQKRERRLGAAWGNGIPLRSTNKGHYLPFAGSEVKSASRILQDSCQVEFDWHTKKTSAIFFDKTATKQSFIETIKQLAQSTGVGDLIVLYVSSHAGFVKDEDGDEDDSRGDEALVFFDQRMTDDELGLCLRQLWNRRVVIVLDTCFAGGFTKHEKGGRVPKIDLDYFDYKKTIYSRDIDQPGIVVLACTSHHKKAPTGSFSHSQFAIAFRQTIADAVKSRKTLSVSNLHVELQERLKSKAYMPVLTGDTAVAKEILLYSAD